MAKKKRKNKVRSIIAPITSPKQVRKEVGAAARLKYKPVQKDIRREKKISKRQSGNVKSWYKQHQKQLGNIRQQGIGAQNQFIDQVQESGAQSAAADRANRADTSAAEQRAASLYGSRAQTAPNAAAAEAANQRQNIIASNVGRMAAQGQTNANMLGAIKGASRLGRDQMLRDERNIRREAGKDLRDLKRERGDYKVQTRRDIRGEERDWNLQNKTLGSKADYNDAIRDVARLGVKRARVSGNKGIKQANIYGATDRYKADKYTKGQKGSKGPDREELGRADGYLKSMLQKTDSNGNSPTWRDVWNNEGRFVSALVNRGVSKQAARRTVKNFVNRKRKVNAKNKVGSKAWQKENDKRSGR